MELLAVFISVIGLLIYTALLLQPLPNNKLLEVKEYPFVSILISVRNESQNIQTLLDSIGCLNYPQDKYEVLIGDDNSDDNTLNLISQSRNKQIHYFAYTDIDDCLTGKQYVLNNLLKHAKGDCVLFTDGDMELSPNWIRAMLVDSKEEVKLHVGLTQVAGVSWFAKFQNIDWLLNQYLVMWFGQRGTYLTAWGNNLAANRSTLGRVQWPITSKPNLVEDVELMHQVLGHGGYVKYVYNETISTGHEKTLFDLLNQRKRWMQGLYKVPFIFKILMLIKLLFFPATIFLMSTHIVFGVFIIIKCIVLMLLFKRLSKISNADFSKSGILIFDLYELPLYMATFIYFLFPFRNKWKGRTY